MTAFLNDALFNTRLFSGVMRASMTQQPSASGFATRTLTVRTDDRASSAQPS